MKFTKKTYRRAFLQALTYTRWVESELERPGRGDGLPSLLRERRNAYHQMDLILNRAAREGVRPYAVVPFEWIR